MSNCKVKRLNYSGLVFKKKKKGGKSRICTVKANVWVKSLQITIVCLLGWLYSHACKTLTPLSEIISRVGSECPLETFWHLTFNISHGQSSSPRICRHGRESSADHTLCNAHNVKNALSNSEMMSPKVRRMGVRKRSDDSTDKGAISRWKIPPCSTPTLSLHKGKSCLNDKLQRFLLFRLPKQNYCLNYILKHCFIHL